MTDADGQADADNERALLLAMSAEWRVALVKLADRLHNMRTLRHMPAHKQVRKARETLRLYVPLAAKLGVGPVETELRALSARHMLPPELQPPTPRAADVLDKALEVIPGGSSLLESLAGLQRPLGAPARLLRRLLLLLLLSPLAPLRAAPVPCCLHLTGWLNATLLSPPVCYLSPLKTSMYACACVCVCVRVHADEMLASDAHLLASGVGAQLSHHRARWADHCSQHFETAHMAPLCGVSSARSPAHVPAHIAAAAAAPIVLAAPAVANAAAGIFF